MQPCVFILKEFIQQVHKANYKLFLKLFFPLFAHQQCSKHHQFYEERPCLHGHQTTAISSHDTMQWGSQKRTLDLGAKSEETP